MNFEECLAEWLEANSVAINQPRPEWERLGELLSSFLYGRKELPFPARCGCCEVVAVRLVPGKGYTFGLALIPRKIGATIQ